MAHLFVASESLLKALMSPELIGEVVDRLVLTPAIRNQAEFGGAGGVEGVNLESERCVHEGEKLLVSAETNSLLRTWCRLDELLDGFPDGGDVCAMFPLGAFHLQQLVRYLSIAGEQFSKSDESADDCDIHHYRPPTVEN